MNARALRSALPLAAAALCCAGAYAAEGKGAPAPGQAYTDSIRVWTYVIVGATFALYLGIAIATRARTTGGFYVAGHGVPAIFNGMATGADWMSAPTA